MNHGGCRISTRRESTRTALGLLQHSEKNSVTASGNMYTTTPRRVATRFRESIPTLHRNRVAHHTTLLALLRNLKMRDEIRVFVTTNISRAIAFC